MKNDSVHAVVLRWRVQDWRPIDAEALLSHHGVDYHAELLHCLQSQ